MAKLGRARNRAIAQSRSAAAASRSTSLIQRVSRGCFGIRRTNSGPLAALWHPSGSCRWPVGPRPLSVALSVVRAWAGRGVVLSCIVLGSPSPQTLALPHLTVTSLSAPVAASYHKSNKRETMTPKSIRSRGHPKRSPRDTRPSERVQPNACWARERSARCLARVLWHAVRGPHTILGPLEDASFAISTFWPRMKSSPNSCSENALLVSCMLSGRQVLSVRLRLREKTTEPSTHKPIETAAFGRWAHTLAAWRDGVARSGRASPPQVACRFT